MPLRRFDRADVLGAKLRLTDAERTHLRITTIGACDFNKAARKGRNLLRKRGRDRITAAKKRQEQGAHLVKSTWLNVYQREPHGKPKVFLAERGSAAGSVQSERKSRVHARRRTCDSCP